MKRVYELAAFAALVALVWLPEQYRWQCILTALTAVIFRLVRVAGEAVSDRDRMLQRDDAVAQAGFISPSRDGEIIYRSEGAERERA